MKKKKKKNYDGGSWDPRAGTPSINRDTRTVEVCRYATPKIKEGGGG